MKLKQIPNNTVVHIPTEAEAKELLAILHENGYKWSGGEALNEITRRHIRREDEVCYKLYVDNMIVTQTSKIWFEINETTILTLADFKRLYCEEETPQPKFEEGDIVLYKGKRKVVHSVNSTLSEPIYTLTTLDYQSPIQIEEHHIEPYSEPETKLTEDMETKDYPPSLDHPKTMVETPVKELNLCELLKGHEGEEFFSLAYGEVVLEGIRRGTQRGDSPDFLSVRATSFDSGTIIVNPNGKLRNAGVVDLIPSRALYEQYPLDPYAAWMEWQKEQKKIALDVNLRTYDAPDFGEVLYFRTPSDRDKCIEEIKAIIEKYSKK